MHEGKTGKKSYKVIFYPSDKFITANISEILRTQNEGSTKPLHCKGVFFPRNTKKLLTKWSSCLTCSKRLILFSILTLKWARNLAADNYEITWPQGSSLPITIGQGLSYVLEQQNFDYLIEIIYISMDVLVSHKIKHLIFSILLHQHLVAMNSKG